MVKWLSKILLIAVSLLFFVSATEMDLGECHNTFFDEYDTYVKAEQPSVDQPTSLQQDSDTYTSIYFVISQYKAIHEQLHIKSSHVAYHNQYPPKIFLRNSVWRIWFYNFSLQHCSVLPDYHLYFLKSKLLFPTLIILLWTSLTGLSVFPFIINWSLVLWHLP